MAFDSTDEFQNKHSVIVLPDEASVNPLYHSPMNSIHLESLNIKGEMCLNSESDLLNPANKIDKVNPLLPIPCILDVDIEKGKTEIPDSSEESVDNMKSDVPIAKVFRREICLQIGVKLMQFLMNYGPDLTKFTSRDKCMSNRAYEMASNRARKYKRSTSFNSRRVVLMFSFLSSLGTIILIYLTLKVRQLNHSLTEPRERMLNVCGDMISIIDLKSFQTMFPWEKNVQIVRKCCDSVAWNISREN